MDNILWSAFENRVNHVREVIDGRLELFWDVPEDYPIVEILISGLKQEVDKKCKDIRSELKSFGITDDFAEVELKETNIVNVYFEKDISDKDLNTIVEILQQYGDRED